jgi:hypothetical protein
MNTTAFRRVEPLQVVPFKAQFAANEPFAVGWRICNLGDATLATEAYTLTAVDQGDGSTEGQAPFLVPPLTRCMCTDPNGSTNDAFETKVVINEPADPNSMSLPGGITYRFELRNLGQQLPNIQILPPP